MPSTVRVQVQRASPSTRAYARSVHHPGCPCQILYVYKYSVRAQAHGPTHDRCMTQAVYAINLTCTSTACKPKHAGLSPIGASPRLSMPNTVRVHVQRASPSTRAYGRSVHRPGCSCRILYGYKYSVRAQARGPTHDRCIAQAIRAISCTCASTACKPKHAGLSTVGASPMLSMPNIVQAQYARSVHRPGCPCQILYGYKYSVRAQARGPTHDRYIAQVVHAKHCTGTSIACEPKHKDLSTVGALPRLSMP